MIHQLRWWIPEMCTYAQRGEFRLPIGTRAEISSLAECSAQSLSAHFSPTNSNSPFVNRLSFIQSASLFGEAIALRRPLQRKQIWSVSEV